ncbi:integrator complex subunit 11 [Dendrobium catenatum]|uniref:Integrator complex subunit 11 n=1 Tax=Dendrobium catenatum TaxID=906689 RepID=A0A2I0VUE7_9ASPA|nr:integrator complex subunit 11 [Dendrobium catenatum]
MLVAPITFEEVKIAVFDGKVSSSPGPDGFSYAFYRSTWHILGPQLFNAVNYFFTSGSFPKGVKATAITLIPKCSHASNINHYRPISLCNVFYKIVAKIIADRLKMVLPFIIHDSQSGFIANRCSTDNIILAAEVLRDFKSSQKSFCAKLDIKKAFDSVSTEFLIARLLQKGFPEVFVFLDKRMYF